MKLVSATQCLLSRSCATEGLAVKVCGAPTPGQHRLTSEQIKSNHPNSGRGFSVGGGHSTWFAGEVHKQ